METAEQRRSSFTTIYEENRWGGESRSGPSSNLAETVYLREDLQAFLGKEKIKSFLDAGSGDFHWQKELDWDGISIIFSDIVEKITEKFEGMDLPGLFVQHDFVEGPLPSVKFDDNEDAKSAVMVRGVFQHLPTEAIRKFIRNVLDTNCSYLITDHHPSHIVENFPLATSDPYRCRKINLFKDPFNFPRPYQVFRDCDHKAMSVWKTEDLRKLEWLSTPREPTVLLAILARNKAHVLPDYLECILNQTYPKEKISLYIRTNNNDDDTREILQKWVEKNGKAYRAIEFDDIELIGQKEQLQPHQWTSERFSVLAKIRQISLEKTITHSCDYYFVVDCDNFIAPGTLAHLLDLQRPIVAPLLKAIPKPNDPYSNFFSAINEWGFYANHPLYNVILNRNQIGCFQVPVVHCTYLIDRRVLPLLSYTDGSGDYEFVVFCRSARKANISQYITNELNFGTLLHPEDNVSLKQEQILFETYKEKNGLLI